MILFYEYEGDFSDRNKKNQEILYVFNATSTCKNLFSQHT